VTWSHSRLTKDSHLSVSGTFQGRRSSPALFYLYRKSLKALTICRCLLSDSPPQAISNAGECPAFSSRPPGRVRETFEFLSSLPCFSPARFRAGLCKCPGQALCRHASTFSYDPADIDGSRTHCPPYARHFRQKPSICRARSRDTRHNPTHTAKRPKNAPGYHLKCPKNRLPRLLAPRWGTSP